VIRGTIYVISGRISIRIGAGDNVADVGLRFCLAVTLVVLLIRICFFTERCAVKGELVFGPAGHGLMLGNGCRYVKRPGLRAFSIDGWGKGTVFVARATAIAHG
jgi:hypothetical protein